MTQEALIKARNQLKRAAQVIQSLCPQGYIHPVLGSIHGAIVDVQEALSEHAMSEVQRLGQEIEQEPVTNRLFLEKMLAAMEGVIDVADRKTDEFEALRRCVVDLTLMLHSTPQRTEQEPTQGIPRKGCQYLSAADRVCNKCGDIHRADRLIDFLLPQDTSPQRKPLTDEIIAQIAAQGHQRWLEFARAIEAAHDIKE